LFAERCPRAFRQVRNRLLPLCRFRGLLDVAPRRGFLFGCRQVILASAKTLHDLFPRS